MGEVGDGGDRARSWRVIVAFATVWMRGLKPLYRMTKGSIWKKNKGSLKRRRASEL